MSACERMADRLEALARAGRPRPKEFILDHEEFVLLAREMDGGRPGVGFSVYRFMGVRLIDGERELWP